jgi:hypothetical protein
LFSKLAAKYNVPNPLKSALVNTPISSESQVSTPSQFGENSFSDKLTKSKKPPLFGVQTSASSFPFGASTPQVSNQPSFGASVGSTQSSFGGTISGSSTPFGSSSTNNHTSSSPFGQNTASLSVQSPPFGQLTTPSSAQSPSGVTGTNHTALASMIQSGPNAALFNGHSPRDLLYSFYQQYNPQKLAEVDKLLGKYQGNEEQMFRNLAKKYNMDPSVFGLSAAPSAGFGSGMGAVGSSVLPTGFGQPSSLGGGPTFGGTNAPSTPSFNASPFGSSATAPTGFGFGALAQSTPSPGFGSFGATNSSPFGAATPFGAPRR